MLLDAIVNCPNHTSWGDYSVELSGAYWLTGRWLEHLCKRLFQENPAVLEAYQTRFQHLLVDEYQDTNKAQYTLVSLLASVLLPLRAKTGSCSLLVDAEFL